MSFLKYNLTDLVRYMRRDIWRIHVRDLGTARAYWIRALRVLALTFRGLVEDRFLLRASALTYFSLLAVVPALAIGFGIAKGFGLEKSLERVLYETLEGQEAIVSQASVFAHRLLDNTRGGVMAFFGLILLFWACFRLLGMVEGAFNEIWGIQTGRGIGRRIADYLAILVIGPIFLIVSSAINVFITSEVNVFVQEVTLLETFSPLIYWFLRVLPFVSISLLLAIIYLLMPHTKVHFRSGMLAGVIAGIMFLVFQGLYIKFQVFLSGYNAVYGSFAALPLFFIWLRLSWLIVLFGAEISCAHQNSDTYEYELDRLRISPGNRRLLALTITHLVISRFADREKEAGATEIATELGLPIPLVNQILFELVGAGVLAEVMLDQSGDTTFHPALDTDKITLFFVVEALEKRGADYLLPEDAESLTRISERLGELADMVRNAPANLPLKDI